MCDVNINTSNLKSKNASSTIRSRKACKIISYHFISYHFISYHIISVHIISYHIISYHIIIITIIIIIIINYHNLKIRSYRQQLWLKNKRHVSHSSQKKVTLACPYVHFRSNCVRANDLYWHTFVSLHSRMEFPNGPMDKDKITRLNLWSFPMRRKSKDFLDC